MDALEVHMEEEEEENLGPEDAEEDDTGMDMLISGQPHSLEGSGVLPEDGQQETTVYLSAITKCDPDAETSNHQTITVQEDDDKSGIATIPSSDTTVLQVEGQVLQLMQATAESGGGPQIISAGTTVGGHTLQTISLGDAASAYNRFLEGQTIQLEDGTTAIVQAKHDTATTRVIEGQMVQLEDGTTGFLQAASQVPEGLQPVQLEDGTTAYIPSNLFTSDGGVVSGFGLDQLGQQLQVRLASSGGLLQQASAPVLVAEPHAAQTGLADTPQLIMESQTESEGGEDQTDLDNDIQVITPVCNVDSTTVLTPRETRMPSEKALALGDKAYRCAYEGCSRLYTTQHHLKVHERSHTGDRPFKCAFHSCGKTFATGYGLKSHTRVHTGEKPYKCPEDICDKSFKTSGDLQKHVRTHTGERPFKCPFEGCERSFTTSNIRKVHIRTHTGERPYTCTEDGCGKSFASATNYKNHIRIHSGEKPYVCTVQGCGKRFTEYSSLYKHHVVHTHSKPYICNHCGKTYRQTSTLAMHKRTAHGDELPVDAEGHLVEAIGNIKSGSGSTNAQCIQVRLADGATTAEDGEGTLVINTSDVPQVAVMTSQAGHSLTSNGQTTLSALTGHQQMAQAVLEEITPSASLALPGQIGIQQVYLVTHPSQLEALKHMTHQQLLAADGQTHKQVASFLEGVAIPVGTATDTNNTADITIATSAQSADVLNATAAAIVDSISRQSDLV